MSLGLDTSVVLRLLVGEPADQAEAAWRMLQERRAPVVVSDLVVAETFFALQHHYGVPAGEAARALRELLADRRVQPSGAAMAALGAPERPTKGQPGLVDRLIHAHYAADGMETASFDRAMARLPGVIVPR